MRRFLCVMLAMLVVCLPAFGGGAAEESTDVVELNVWFGREQFIPGDRFETFHRENPNIRINADVIPLEEAFSSYVRAYRAGQAPDIVQILTFSQTALAEQGMLMDIRPILDVWRREAPEHYNDMAPATWQIPSHNGVTHGMALHVAPYWYIYRKDMFDRAGIPQPRTWDDAIEAGRQLARDGVVGFTKIGFAGHIDWFISLFLYMGGQYSDDNVIQLDSPAGVYLLEFYQQMMRYGIAHPDTIAWDSGDMRANFMSGEAAQAFEGANMFAEFNRHLSYGDQWVALPGLVSPGAEGQWVVPGNSWPYVVSSRATGKEEAIRKFFQYLSRTEIIKEVALRYQPATRMSVFEDPEYLRAQPWFATLRDYYAQQQPIPVHPSQPQINQILGEAMQEALSRPNADAREMASRYQRRINEVAAR